MAHTILLADDSVTVRRVVELTFSGTDVRVDSVGSGAEALERFAAGRPDLVLADVTMPPPSGYDLCRRIKEADRSVPVLLLCGAFESFDERRARECGADGHVVKPFESENLIARVTRLLARARELPKEEVPEPAPDGEAEAALMDLVEGGPEGAGETTEAELLPEREDDDTEVSVQRALDATPEQVPVAEDDAGSEAVPVEVRRSSDGEEPAPHDVALTEQDLDTIAREVASRLSEQVVREIAWEVVPELAEILIRERIRQIENDDRDGP